MPDIFKEQQWDRYVIRRMYVMYTLATYSRDFSKSWLFPAIYSDNQ